MRAIRIPLFVLLAVLFFILWNAAWVTDRCGEWTAAVDTVTADLDAGGDGGALTLRVQTHEAGWHLPRKGTGRITLRYTLVLGTQPMSELHLELTLTKEENN